MCRRCFCRRKVHWTIASWATRRSSPSPQQTARYTLCCNSSVTEVSSKLGRQRARVGACGHRTKLAHRQTHGAAVPASSGVPRPAVIPCGATLASTATISNVLRPVLWTRTYPETFWEVSRCRVPHGGAVSLVRRPSLLLHDTSIIFRIVRQACSRAMKLLKISAVWIVGGQTGIWFELTFFSLSLSRRKIFQFVGGVRVMMYDGGQGRRGCISWISRLLVCAVLSFIFLNGSVCGATCTFNNDNNNDDGQPLLLGVHRAPSQMKN